MVGVQQEGSPAHAMLEELHGGLADDLNTSPVISALSEPLKRANDFCHTRKVTQVPLDPACAHCFCRRGLRVLWLRV